MTTTTHDASQGIFCGCSTCQAEAEADAERIRAANRAAGHPGWDDAHEQALLDADNAPSGGPARRCYAAIDATNISGAVYGIGHTEAQALADARRGEPSDDYAVVPCTEAAYALVKGQGGAPSRELCVSVRSPCLDASGARLPSVHLCSECEGE